MNGAIFTAWVGQTFAKLKALSLKAARRPTDGSWRPIGELVDHFPPAECANQLVNSGYDRSACTCSNRDRRGVLSFAFMEQVQAVGQANCIRTQNVPWFAWSRIRFSARRS